LSGSLPVDDRLSLVLPEGGALALGASAIVWLSPPDDKGPEEMLVGAVPADAQVPGAVVGLGRILERLMPGRVFWRARALLDRSA
jgi:hypothetical protein